jgi:catechol 2,3-dioxygenase-like lactoylglutathione lyase family enzyme
MQVPNGAALGPSSASKENLLSDPNFVILYVKSPTESAAFYAGLLGKPPVEASPTFAMFALDSGVMLGLWAAHTVQPAATAVGGAEIAFAVDGNDTVRALHAAWRAKGLELVQAPTDMDFGHTFVALDPDGHRLRVFAPSAP